MNVYNEFWLEVKPKDGPSDAYAPGANFADKEFMAKLKGLKPGTRYYGKTKEGRYMSEQDAIQQGYHAAGGR